MDEDIEFREMMLKNLETNGFLQDIRAKLRAQIYFSAYENNQSTDTTNNFPNNEHIGNSIPIIDTNTTIDTDSLNCSQPVETQESGGKISQSENYESLALGLVQDLLDSLNLCHTKSVFKSELSSLTKIRSSGHIVKILDLSPSGENNGETNDSSADENCLNNDDAINSNTEKSPLLIKLLEKYIQQNHLKPPDSGDSLNSSSDNTEKSYNSSASVVVNNDTFISTKTAATAASTITNQLSESL